MCFFRVERRPRSPEQERYRSINRPPPRSDPESAPRNVDIHYGFALVRVCRSCIRLQARASQRFLAFTSSSIFRVIASRTSPRLHSLCNNDIGIIHVVTGVPASTTGPRLQPFGSNGICMSWWWPEDCVTR